MPSSPRLIETLDELAGAYRAVLCDVWGVLHNGVGAFPEACEALRRARARGLSFLPVPTSPRPGAGVERQLAGLGVGAGVYDGLVTSGDVTRELIRRGPRRIFHLGPERDLALFEGLDVELVEEFEAAGIVCTGLFDDVHETPADYAEMLRRLRSRDLPMVCANPDIAIERGDSLVWCAGALARDYAALGGRTEIAGKPHHPIYQAALAAAGAALGRAVEPAEALAVGDGILTDVKGAEAAGIDVLYVSAGVHAREYGGAGGHDPGRLAAFLESHGHHPVAVIPKLC